MEWGCLCVHPGLGAGYRSPVHPLCGQIRLYVQKKFLWQLNTVCARFFPWKDKRHPLQNRKEKNEPFVCTRFVLVVLPHVWICLLHAESIKIGTFHSGRRAKKEEKNFYFQNVDKNQHWNYLRLNSKKNIQKLHAVFLWSPEKCTVLLLFFHSFSL